MKLKLSVSLPNVILALVVGWGPSSLLGVDGLQVMGQL